MTYVTHEKLESRRNLVQILLARRTLASNDPTGRLEYAYMTISGPMVQAIKLMLGDPFKDWPYTKSQIEVNGTLHHVDLDDRGCISTEIPIWCLLCRVELGLRPVPIYEDGAASHDKFE